MRSVSFVVSSSFPRSEMTWRIQHILQHVETWCSLSHPNVVKLFGLSPHDADPLFVIHEFMAKGWVMQYLKSNEGQRVDRAKLVSLLFPIVFSFLRRTE